MYKIPPPPTPRNLLIESNISRLQVRCTIELHHENYHAKACSLMTQSFRYTNLHRYITICTHKLLFWQCSHTEASLHIYVHTSRINGKKVILRIMARIFIKLSRSQQNRASSWELKIQSFKQHYSVPTGNQQPRSQSTPTFSIPRFHSHVYMLH